MTAVSLFAIPSAITKTLLSYVLPNDALLASVSRDSYAVFRTGNAVALDTLSAGCGSDLMECYRYRINAFTVFPARLDELDAEPPCAQLIREYFYDVS